MYYPNGAMYPEKSRAGGEDVLDLCVRKRDVGEPREKYEGDVNGNGYAEDSNELFKGRISCKSPGESREQPQERFLHSDPDSTPILLQEKIYPEERIQSPGNRNYPVSNLLTRADPPLTSHFTPLPQAAISNITNRNGKPTRPFKAYPKEFFPLATSEGLLDDSNQRYLEFRRQFLAQLHATSALTSNKNMKRPVQSDSPNQLPSSSGDARDQAYWERRKKNNEAAKKSRDARRAKEDEIAIRAAFLERENVQLKLELASLRRETDRLRCMLYTS